MSSRARRVVDAAVLRPFRWPGDGLPDPEPSPSPERQPSAVDLEQMAARQAALEREAFARGYEHGERAGREAGAGQIDAMLGRLASAIDDLHQLRHAILQRSEQQIIALALAMARRIVRREVEMDRELALAMARIALDRLGEVAQATLKLNPDDHAVLANRTAGALGASAVTLVPDPGVARGGCVVESDLGVIEATVEAQFNELARALDVDEMLAARAT